MCVYAFWQVACSTVCWWIWAKKTFHFVCLSNKIPQAPMMWLPGDGNYLDTTKSRYWCQMSRGSSIISRNYFIFGTHCTGFLSPWTTECKIVQFFFLLDVMSGDFVMLMNLNGEIFCQRSQYLFHFVVYFICIICPHKLATLFQRCEHAFHSLSCRYAMSDAHGWVKSEEELVKSAANEASFSLYQHSCKHAALRRLMSLQSAFITFFFFNNPCFTLRLCSRGQETVTRFGWSVEIFVSQIWKPAVR